VRFVIYSDGSGTNGGPAGIGFIVLANGLPFSEGSLHVDEPDACASSRKPGSMSVM
jgi:hypothetical protein